MYWADLNPYPKICSTIVNVSFVASEEYVLEKVKLLLKKSKVSCLVKPKATFKIDNILAIYNKNAYFS